MTSVLMAGERDHRAKLADAWVHTVTRLIRAEQPPDLVFETMALVAITGMLKTREPQDVARFLREIADAAEARQELGPLLRQLNDILRENAPKGWVD